jgi:hypothetical protein
MFYNINALKTKRICFIQGLSAYRAVNTLHLGYKNQSLNVLNINALRTKRICFI